MDKDRSHSKGSPASWTLGSTTEGRFAISPGRLGITLKTNFTISSHGVLAPARSTISGSRLFTSAGGFPEWTGSTSAKDSVYACYEGHTVEEIWNPDIYPNLLSEVVRYNPWVRQGKAEYICEEDDCFCPLCGVVRCGSKIVLADHGALGLTREGETLVAIRATHG